MNYKDIDTQLKEFIKIIKMNKDLMMIFDYIATLNLPNFYIASGSLFQTIWNYQDGKVLTNGLKDIDVIYYDKDNLIKESEQQIEDRVKDFFYQQGYEYDFDIHNEARMHLWKKANENAEIDQYKNSEDAIDQWIATVQAIGITKENGELKVYAPYGLSDIFSRTIRPIKHKGTNKELYDSKTKKWQSRFDNLNVVEW